MSLGGRIQTNNGQYTNSWVLQPLKTHFFAFFSQNIFYKAYVIRKRGTEFQIMLYSHLCTSSGAHIIQYTVNVDIFAYIHFRGFIKMGNFTCIKIRFLNITSSLGYYKSNFRGVHIFADI